MIGWENNQGAYFVQKLQEQIDDAIDNIGDVSDLNTTADNLTSAVNEVDTAVKTKVKIVKEISGGTTLNMDVQNSSRFVLLAIGTASARTGMWFCHCSSQGTVVATPIIEAGASLTLTASTNALALALGGTSSTCVCAIVFQGDVKERAGA